MNKVDRYIRSCMLRYPQIFPTRTSVLEHAFCVVGNGMEWDETGCLVDIFPEEPLHRQVNLAEDAHLIAQSLEHVYPMSSEYSKMCCAPDNIDSAWTAALHEIAQAIMLYEEVGSGNYNLAKAALEDNQ